MTYELDAAGVRRLEAYFEGIGERLGEKRRRASFALYAMGILGEHERKSGLKPLAAAAADDPRGRAAGARSICCTSSRQSEWEDGSGPRVRCATRRSRDGVARAPSSAWVIDDTGFMKQGRESPGVQRQCTGSVGKVANCRIGVSLTLCTADRACRSTCSCSPAKVVDERPRPLRAGRRSPARSGFAQKWQIALEMMEHASREAGTAQGRRAPPDAAYGNVGEFRAPGFSGSTSNMRSESMPIRS